MCASSACPDDIDPSNAWEVTDVHVRVYSPQNRFSMAVARRVTADAEAVLTRETAFHSEHLGADQELRRVPRLLAAPLLQQRGRRSPSTGPAARSSRSWTSRRCASGRCSAPTPRRCMQRVVTRNIRKLAVGQVVYTALCNETGGMIDDATVFRLGQDNFRFVGGDEYDGIWMREVADQLGLEGLDQADHRPAAQHRRPGAAEPRGAGRVRLDAAVTAARSTELEVVPLPGRADRRPTTGSPIVVSRTGYTGELGYEIFCHPVRRPRRCGTRCSDGRRAARDASRWASRRSTWCASSPGSSSPATSSTTRSTRSRPASASPSRSTTEDFIGRDALLERREHPQRTLVGLELEGNEVVGHGDEVYVDRRRVGVVTSGMRVPDAAQVDRPVPDGRPATPRSARRSRSASSTGSRSGSPPPSYDSPSMTRRRNARGRDRD